MNNLDVKKLLDDCEVELGKVKLIVDKNPLDSSVIYLNRYSIIKACGTIEVSFKSLVADFCDKKTKTQQVKNFINSKVRNGSMNPNPKNIYSLLKEFDDQWNKDLKQKIINDVNGGRLFISLQSLVDARNEFAHGGNPVATIHNIECYYKDAAEIIKYIDSIII